MTKLQYFFIFLAFTTSQIIYDQYKRSQLDTCYVSDTHTLTQEDNKYIQVLVCSKKNVEKQ